MKVYLVRNHETKSILGLFWSDRIRDLWWEVDCAADPGLYEYSVMTHGSLCFHGEEPVPDQADEDVEAFSDDFSPSPMPWSEASPSEFLFEALHHSCDVKWRKFPYADEPGGGAHEVVAAAADRREGACQ